MATYKLVATKVKANNVQEDSWLGNGDEFYVAMPWLRATMGKPGSSRAGFAAKLSEVDVDTDDRTAKIPAKMGTVSFASVAPVTLAQFNDPRDPRKPELLVVVSAALESDATPFSLVTSKFKKLASAMKPHVGTAIIEKMDSTDTSTFKARLATAMTKIVETLKPSFWGAVGLWLRSLGDPDDRINYKVTVLVAADDKLWSQVKPTLTGAGKAVDVRQLRAGATFAYTFTGDNAKYTVDYVVKKG